jgi:uncharacterized repeat protein (TIGR01451 family)
VQGDGLLIPQGSPISWIYTVTNTGNVPLSNVQVTDNKGVVPVYKSGDTNQDGKLDLTESWVYSANGTAISGSYQNLGTAQGSYSDGLNNLASPTASDPSSYTGVRPPGARTPGFWQAWTAVWDGTASNDSSFADRSDFLSQRHPATTLLRSYSRSSHRTDYGEREIAFPFFPFHLSNASSQRTIKLGRPHFTPFDF